MTKARVVHRAKLGYPCSLASHMASLCGINKYIISGKRDIEWTYHWRNVTCKRCLKIKEG